MNLPIKNLDTEYQYKKFLGKGGYGLVTLTTQTRTQTEYAVKQIIFTDIRKRERKNNQGMKMVQNEIQHLKELSHSNIVKYIESFQDSDGIYIVMEYINGKNLTQTIANLREENKNEPLINDFILFIFRQLLSTLEYIHSKDIIHSDIKPENIVIQSNNPQKIHDFQPILIDFGSSRKTTDPESCQDIRGTGIFIDPYLLDLEIGHPSNDLWSLAITIMDSLGYNPWNDNSSDSMDLLLNRIEHSTQLPHLNTSNSFLNQIVNSILVLDIKQRPSISHLLNQIKQHSPNFMSQPIKYKKSSNDLETFSSDNSSSDLSGEIDRLKYGYLTN
jgi:serine/threonine protein kinase